MLKIGNVDIVQVIFENELRIIVLEKAIEKLSKLVPQGSISQTDIDRFKAEGTEELLKKYPGVLHKNP